MNNLRGLIALQNKLGSYKRNFMPAISERWSKIQEVLAQCPSEEIFLSHLASIGLLFADFEAQYGTKKIGDAIDFAKDLKDRYSVLWLYFTLCYRKNKT